MNNFRQELAELINKYSAENGSNTPDYVLADYLTECLLLWNRTTNTRDAWYGIAPAPGKLYTKE